MDQPTDIFAAGAMGRADHFRAALERDPPLVTARFCAIRTVPEDHYVNGWATMLWFTAMNQPADHAHEDIANLTSSAD